MGPAYYILAILGCGEGDAACEQVAMADAKYESLEACNAATEGALLRSGDFAFPVVVAQCRQEDSAVTQRLTPDQVDLPDPDRKLRVQPASASSAKPVRL